MSAAARATRRTVLASLAAAMALPAAPALTQGYQHNGGDYLPVDGGRLWYEAAGAGRTVILMHDAITDSSVWDDVWPIFAREFRVVRYDQRGSGRTPAATSRYTPAADVLALIAHLAVPSAVLIAGSASAQTAIECAITRPAQVQQLLLVSPVLGDIGPRPLEERIQANNAPLASDDVAGAIDNWVNDRNIVAGPNRRARARLRAILEASPQDLTHRDAMIPPRVSMAPVLNRIQAQTLILAGARDLPGVISQGENLARMIPGAQRAPVQGSGHLIYLDEPEIFAAAAIAFVRAWQSRDP